MKKELFINEELRTLQHKIKNEKASENCVVRPGMDRHVPKFPTLNPPKTKNSEKLFAEKNAEKCVQEKTAEKCVAEKQHEAKLPPQTWQTMFIHRHDDNRLF